MKSISKQVLLDLIYSEKYQKITIHVYGGKVVLVRQETTVVPGPDEKK